MNIVVIVQARSSSTRLPNKVNMQILGKSVLYRQLERMMKSKYNNIVVATTIDNTDDVIELEVKDIEGIKLFRGHPTDLLDRHYQAAKTNKADYVVKIPSDCPLIDPQIIDDVIDYFIENKNNYDFVSNLHPATFPDGNDVEIMPFNILEIAWQEASKDFEREHTTPFIWDNPERFRIGNYSWSSGKDYSMTHRFTIDYLEDYLFINKVYEELYPLNPSFYLDDILNLLVEKPKIYEINSKYCGVNWYRNHITELKTVENSQTKII